MGQRNRAEIKESKAARVTKARNRGNPTEGIAEGAANDIFRTSD